jgi:hypothetical protein
MFLNAQCLAQVRPQLVWNAVVHFAGLELDQQDAVRGGGDVEVIFEAKCD